MATEMSTQVTLSACLVVIGLLGSSATFTPLKHNLDNFFAYNQCIYDNQIQALKTIQGIKQDGYRLGTSLFGSQFSLNNPTPSKCQKP